MENREIEVRFLEINKEDLISKIRTLGGIDHEETMLQEIIFKIKGVETRNEFVRLRDTSKKVSISYKNHTENTNHQLNNVEEIEIEVKSDFDTTKKFLIKSGLSTERYQQKLRHTLELDGVSLDIDTWPRIPPYVELEGSSLEQIQSVAQRLGLDWGKVTYENARSVIENSYQIKLGELKYFTFDKFE